MRQRSDSGMGHQPPRHRTFLQCLFQGSSQFLDLGRELVEYVEQVLASSARPSEPVQSTAVLCSGQWYWGKGLGKPSLHAMLNPQIRIYSKHGNSDGTSCSGRLI
jgi:hypothetical protein